jgi:hypothetical protein
MPLGRPLKVGHCSAEARVAVDPNGPNVNGFDYIIKPRGGLGAQQRSARLPMAQFQRLHGPSLRPLLPTSS